MKHVDSPAINCDVLTSDEESIENKECSEFVDFFVFKHLVNREVKVVQDHAPDQLHWHNPRLSLSERWKVVKFNEWRPQNLE